MTPTSTPTHSLAEAADIFAAKADAARQRSYTRGMEGAGADLAEADAYDHAESLVRAALAAHERERAAVDRLREAALSLLLEARPLSPPNDSTVPTRCLGALGAAVRDLTSPTPADGGGR